MDASVTPITATNPACYGLCCSFRPACARYHAVENRAESAHTLDTCVDHGKWPMFVALARVNTPTETVAA